MSQRPHPALLTGLISFQALAWAVNFIIGKIGLQHLEVFTLASFRVVLAAVVITPIYFLSGARQARFERQDLWKFTQLGLLGVAGNQMLFTVGLNYTTVGHSALIIGLGPILVLLLAWAQGLEALTARKLLGMALSFSGVAVLAAEHGFRLRTGTLRGDLIILSGSVAFALYTVVGKKVAARYDSLTMNTFNHLAGAIAVLPLAVRQGLRLEWGGVNWVGWAALAYMAVVASVVAYLIYYWALRYMGASQLAAFSYLIPLLATLLGVLLLGERVTSHLLVGGTLVLMGVYVTEAGRER